MIKNYLKVIMLCYCSILFGCAGSYKAIKPEKIAFTKEEKGNETISLEYHYNALIETNNKKYYKKEIKNGIQLVAIKITNHTGSDLVYNKNFQLYTGETVLNILPKETVHAQLKQQSSLYLLYLLLTPMRLYSSTPTSGTAMMSNTKSFPIGLIIGPAIALGNLATASSANKKFKSDLDTFDLFNKVIKDGESVNALVGIKSTSFMPINIKFINKENSK